MSEHTDELINILGISFGRLLQIDEERARKWLENTFDQISGEHYRNLISSLERQIADKEKECIRLKRGIVVVGSDEMKSYRTTQK
tara:strand:+ start:421 stop:675 length:255 start_codon:yes stop_codon:yes gene_type:complete